MKNVIRLFHLTLTLVALAGPLSLTIVPETVWGAPDNMTAVVYLAFSTGSNIEHIHGEKIESNSQAVVVLIPETGTAKILEQNTSYDFAKNQLQIYAVDDRLFLLDVSNPHDGEYTDIDLYDLNVTTFERGNRKWITNQPDQDNFAIVAGKAYYRRHRYFKLLIGNRGGEFMVGDLSGSGGVDSLKLLSHDHSDNSPWHKNFSDNGNLYAVYFHEGEDQLQICRRDLTSGEITKVLGDFTITDYEQYERWAFDIDYGAAFWARHRKSDKQVEIWRYNFTDPPELLFAQVLFDESGPDLYDLQMDVDNGHVLLFSYFCDYIILFDSKAKTSSKIELGMTSAYDGAILYQDHPDMQDTDDDSEKGGDENDDGGDDGGGGGGGGG